MTLKHNNTGRHHYRWGGGTFICVGRDIFKKSSEHPRANASGYVRIQILIVESVMGKFLPVNRVIHHIDGDRLNNKRNNLVVCEDLNYQRFLLVRQRSFAATGNPNLRKCPFCKKYGEPRKMQINGHGYCHDYCRSYYNKQYYRKRA